MRLDVVEDLNYKYQAIYLDSNKYNIFNKL
jgi:hypothetical protein